MAVDYLDDMSTASDGNIIDVFGNGNRYAIYNQEGRADLVKLEPKVYKKPFTVEETLVKDVMVFNNDNMGKGYVVERDGSFWILDTHSGTIKKDKVNNILNNSAQEKLAYKDIYCDYDFLELNNYPVYPTTIFESGGFHIKITKNPYINKYNFGCYLDIPDAIIFYKHNVRYFKTEAPIVYVAYDNGIQEYSDVHNNSADGGRSDTVMDKKSIEIENLNDFTDVTKLEYKEIKMDNSEW